ncbi:MAG: protein-L-isoaspartate O-methyltransferase [Halobacteria archaeon]|nr:protein-L-isoaspartate O-methyltransferase [Halobacteria archaeon]
MNLENARFNMIEQQIRPWEVLDQRVLDLLNKLPREDFVPQRYRKLAYADTAIPLDNDQVMMPPRVEARILQGLNIQADETALEVGTGSGYVTALLASLGDHVYSVDINAEMTRTAGDKLADHGITNVTLETGDAARGWDAHAPYDVIVITGSLPLLPDNFKQALKVGGRLVAIVGDSPVMDVVLITRVGEFEWAQETLFETDLPALINAPEPERFTL